MRASSLEHATVLQNATDFGLTAGLHSLDPAEISWWRDRALAGNLYINRPITGAIVQRQPFGGWKKSCVGPGPKAGGPNYVLAFSSLSDLNPETPDDYSEAWASHFSLEHDPSALRAESNIFRYRPSRGVILRLDAPDAAIIHRARRAASITSVPLTISIASQESDDAFIARLPSLAASAEFLRTTTTPSDAILHAAHSLGLNWIHAPLLASGRIELTRWLREQSISSTIHRYGQLPNHHTSPSQ
jgi:RHH-type proline utilization regulon transcriptional repressor/proline dehydrogenase/delta 1-pyrroline-5-carboxylate dehydrogenase